ncbi:uncharacterized protein LOC115087263 [Rhinatrema bivittatum]|uniref:uncharacterized protein LOC115087263 n=1 Tax=Rhinatrema bivittatum TaxID=194408 RepID=UPI00112AE2F7|nr:uncharacterized protein LOC115087263 [Rhinatrema bivittatum]
MSSWYPRHWGFPVPEPRFNPQPLLHPQFPLMPMGQEDLPLPSAPTAPAIDVILSGDMAVPTPEQEDQVVLSVACPASERPPCLTRFQQKLLLACCMVCSPISTFLHAVFLFYRPYCKYVIACWVLLIIASPISLFYLLSNTQLHSTFSPAASQELRYSHSHVSKRSPSEPLSLLAVPLPSGVILVPYHGWLVQDPVLLHIDVPFRFYTHQVWQGISPESLPAGLESRLVALFLQLERSSLQLSSITSESPLDGFRAEFCSIRYQNLFLGFRAVSVNLTGILETPSWKLQHCSQPHIGASEQFQRLFALRPCFHNGSCACINPLSKVPLEDSLSGSNYEFSGLIKGLIFSWMDIFPERN